MAKAEAKSAKASKSASASKAAAVPKPKGLTPEAKAEFELIQKQPLIEWRGVFWVVAILFVSYFAQKNFMPDMTPDPTTNVPPSYFTCYGDAEPTEKRSTALATSMRRWSMEGGANGTVWATNADGERHCYPHGSNKVDGVTHPPWLKQGRVDRLKQERKAMLRPGDILISSFPKSGTTWMEQIVLLLLNQGDASKLNPEHQNELAFDPARRAKKGPGVGAIWMERFLDVKDDLGPPSISFDEFVRLPSPRVIKTHALPMLLLGREPPTHKVNFGDDGNAADLPPPLLPQGVRVIYISRNPKDVALSSFHHPAGTTSPAATGWPLDAFVAMWSEGKVEHGEWSDHVCAWTAYAAAHDFHEAGRKAAGKATDPSRVTRFLEISYEELKADLRSSVKRVAELIGMGDADDALVDAVVAASDFDAMKRLANNASHMREGKVGSGAAAFSKQLSAEFDETFRQRAAKCGLKLE